MSYDQPSSATASIVQGCGSRESHVSPVTFNIDGQPINVNATSLSIMIWRAVKNNIPSGFNKWSNVPDLMKEKVWDIVINKYEIPIDNKEWVLMKANECWRNRKSKLKRYIYTKYHTDMERKKNVTLFVKED